MARRHGTRGNTAGAYSDLSFSQVVAKASTSTGGYSSPDSPVIADEDLEMTRHDPAMRAFFKQTGEESDSEEEEEADEDEEQQHHPHSLYTQDAASSLLGLFAAPEYHQPPLAPQPQLPPEPPLWPNSDNVVHARPQLPLYDPATVPPTLDRATLLQGSTLNDEELAFIDGTANGKNKKKYEETKLSLERRFIQTVKDFGGSSMLPYLDKEWMDHGNGPVQDFALYRLCGGQKSPQKKQVLEYCLILCAMKWQCESGTNKGKPLQPCSFNTMMKQLSYVWKDKGIEFNFAKDFNHAGGFHGVLIKRWNEIRKADPSYGTHPNKSKPDMQYTKKLVEAISNGAIDLNDPKQLQLVVTFILGYYVGLRGSQEHVDLMMAMTERGVYTVEDGGVDLAGLKYFGVRIPYHKANQLKLGNTSLPVEAMKLHTVAEDPSNGIFDPVAIVSKYLDHCHPNATKFYAKPATKAQIASYVKEYGKDIWYCPSSPATSNYNIGPSKLRSNHKELAKLCCCKDWEQMTSHGLRALIINTLKVNGVNAMEVAEAARHKSLNSQNSYNRATGGATENNKQAALRPAAGRKRSPEQFTMTPRKSIAASLMPSPAKSSSALTEKLRLEVESLKMRLQLAQHGAQPAPAPSYFQYHPMGPPPPPMYPHPYAGGWGMPPPPPMYGGYPQHQMPFYTQQQGGVYPHGQQQITMPVQSSIAYQTQPPAMPVHTGRPTQQYHPDQQQEIVQYHGGPNNQPRYGDYYHHG